MAGTFVVWWGVPGLPVGCYALWRGSGVPFLSFSHTQEQTGDQEMGGQPVGAVPA